MSNPTTRQDEVLSDAMYELCLDERPLNAELLDEYARRYQESARELTEFAIELAMDRLRASGGGDGAPLKDEASGAAMSPAVARAVSRFQNRMHGHRAGKAQHLTQASGPGTSGPAVNPFAGLSPEQYKRLVASGGFTSLFVNKFRDRQIEPGSIPLAFAEELSNALPLAVPVEVMVGHFAAAQAVLGGQMFKADQKPELGRRQTFREAVESSNLPAETRRRLLAM